jgi:ABC-2 type transport system ATP-binding protein
MTGVSRVQVEGDRLRCEVETGRVGELLNLLAPHGITSLTCQPPTLESLFLRHYDPGAVATQPASYRVAV